jgi:hypothetical protein
LVGEKILTHTPMLDVRHPFDADSNGICFTLDDTTYLVFEDGNDGYRSSAGPVLSFAGMPYEMGGRGGEYCRLPVVCSWSTEGEYSRVDEVLEMRLKETGQVVLRVGTENTDDYYPCFVAEWMPPLRDGAAA